MSRLRQHVSRSIQQRRLLGRGQKILVAVSGGLDSMVLLHVLRELSLDHRWQLTVAHLNHRLRGRSSDADERFVSAAARKLRLPIIRESVAVKDLARSHKISIEMAARQARHEFLARTAARLKIRTVALAHHADDQVELFFLRLLRGSGSEGLAGMRWKNVSPANPAIELIRPLLDQPRSVLCEYAAAHGIHFREDASNASVEFQRNRIRHELLPLLRRKYQPALERTIARVMDLAGAEAELAGELAAGWLNSTRRKPFGTLPVAVQRRCIQLQLLSRKTAVDFDLVEHLRTKPGQGIKVSPDLTVSSDAGGRVDFRKGSAVGGPDLSRSAVQLSGKTGQCHFGGLRIRWRMMARRGQRRIGGLAGRETFDADKVGSRIVLRHWRAGDRFQPIGMPVKVKLQDLFVNNKIPRARRHELVVATTGEGELFWVESLRIAERFKLSEGTIRCLHWRWKRP